MVSWGNDLNRKSLFNETVIPADKMVAEALHSNSTKLHGGLEHVCVRVLNVPQSFVLDEFPFSEFVAKNVAIRRAKGRRIVVTNIDKFFSDNLVSMTIGVQPQ